MAETWGEPQRLRLAERGGDVMFRLRISPTHALEYVSQGVVDLTGHPPEDHRADPDLLIRSAHPEDQKRLEALLTSPDVPSSASVIRWQREDGSVVWAEVKSFPVRDDLGSLVAVEGVARDVTMRVAQERDIESERNFVTGILDTTDALVVVLDTSARIVSLNRTGERLSGYTNEEARGRSIWEFCLEGEQAEQVRWLFEGIDAGSFPDSYESEWTSRDGTRHLISWAGSAMRGSRGAVDFFIATGIEITEQRRAEREIRLLGTALESAADMVMITGQDGVIQYVNEAFTAGTGYSREEAVGAASSILRSSRQSNTFYTQLWRTILSGSVWAGEIVNRRKDGSEYYEDQTITPVKDRDGGTTHFVAIKRDITERRRVEEELQRLATTDTLTGLLNRHQFMVMLQQSIRLAERRATHGALVYVDVDALKYVNDTYGHSAGDDALRAVAQAFRDGTRSSDIVARIGGDEFSIILHDAPAEAAMEKANELVQRVSELGVTAAGERIQLSCSAGLAPFPIEGVTIDDLRAYADMALYRAKEEGRGRAYLYDPSEGRMETATALQRTRNVIMDALDEDRLILFRQPVVHIATRDTTIWEVLVRLQDAEGVLRLPGEFITGVEELGLVHLLDRRVIERSFERWQQYALAGDRLHLSINISALSAGPDMARFVIEQAAERNVEPQLVTLEVTETAAVRGGPRAERFVSMLCDAGFSLALDDFGTGSASFREIRDLSFAYLKLDGSLVRDLRTDDFSRDLVRGLVNLAHILGLEVIAEFVQDEETMQFLAEVGAEYGQGYYLGRPEPFPPSPVAADSRRVAGSSE